MEDYDVIIIGAGIGGGLPAAAYLQKAGARVLMVDANQEAGCHVKTNEVWPGVLWTPCAAGSFIGNSPAMADLELERYGVNLKLSPRGTGATFPNHKSLFIAPYDIDGTCADIARFSEKDAVTARGILERYVEKIIEFNELCFYSIPTPEKQEKMIEMAAYVWGVAVEDFREMNAFELVETVFEADEVQQTFMCVAGVQTFGDIGEPCQGAFAAVAWIMVIPGQLVGGNHNLAHAYVRIFLEHGGTMWRNCPVEEIIVENGVAKGIKIEESAVVNGGKTIMAKHAVITNAGVPESFRMIGEENLTKADPALAQRMKYWDMSSRASCVSLWVLKGFPKWKSMEWNPNISQMDFFYKGWESLEHGKRWYMAQKSGDVYGALGGLSEAVMHQVTDETAASAEGYVSLRLEEVLPFSWRERGSGSGKANLEMWDEKRDEILEKQTKMFAELIEDFEDQILEKYIVTPLDLWRGNRAGVHGNGIGGSFTGNQWMLERVPYRMPLKNLYCSNGVWPIQLSWGVAGYNAACAVAEDMGIRDQPWWKARPVEWCLQNLGRLLVEKNPYWVE